MNKTEVRKVTKERAHVVSPIPTSLKTPVMKQIELRIQEPVEVYIARLRSQGKTMKYIGITLSVSEGCISRWIKWLGV